MKSTFYSIANKFIVITNKKQFYNQMYVWLFVFSVPVHRLFIYPILCVQGSVFFFSRSTERGFFICVVLKL